MPLLNFPTPNLIGGISQQPDQLKLGGQVSDLNNFIPHPTDGLTRRNELEYMGTASLVALSPCHVHWINRDEAERYCCVVKDQDLMVFGLDGEEFPVLQQSATDITQTASFTYLNIATGTEAPTKFRGLTIADYTFILNREKTAATTGSFTATRANGEAYVWVKASNYNSLYTVSLSHNNSASTNTFRVYVASGTLADTTQSWLFIVTARGGNGSTWTLTYPDGYTRTYVEGVTETVDTIMWGLRESIDTGTAVDAAVHPHGLETFWIVATRGTGIPTLTNSATGTSVSVPTFKTPTTDKVAEKLASEIDAHADWTASAVGPVIKITKQGTAQLIDKIEVTDSDGGTSMSVVWDEVSNVDDLPEYCTHGFWTKVVGGPDSTADDYYVKFDSFDGSGFTKGVWIETYGPGIKYVVDGTTMPHQLVRKQNTALNTPVNGLGAGDIYFEFGPATWESRTVGDEDTAPAPSIFTRQISDLFFYKNRLGFLADQQVVLSEAGRYFNLWRTTVRQVLDADPIDVSVAHTRVAVLNAATLFEDQCILWSDRSQFRLQGDPTLTPKTASIQPISEFQCSPNVRPIGIGRTLMFAAPKRNHTGIYEYFSRGDGLRYDATETTVHVPSLLADDIQELDACPVENTVVARSGTDSVLYLHRYLYSGDEKIQSAWTKLTFWAGSLLGVGIFDTDLYILAEAGTSVHIHRMSLKSENDAVHLSTPVLDCLTLDTQLDPSDIVYDNTTDTTDITLPWNPQTVIDGSPSVGTYVMVARGVADVIGSLVPITAINLNTITVRGDWTGGRKFWVGASCPASVELPKVYLRDQTRGTVQVGTLRLRNGLLSYRNAGYFLVTVEHQGERDDSLAEFTGYTVDANANNTLPLNSGKFRFPINSLNDYADITISTDSTFPVALLGIEWEAEYDARSTRFTR